MAYDNEFPLTSPFPAHDFAPRDPTKPCPVWATVEVVEQDAYGNDVIRRYSGEKRASRLEHALISQDVLAQLDRSLDKVWKAKRTAVPFEKAIRNKKFFVQDDPLQPKKKRPATVLARQLAGVDELTVLTTEGTLKRGFLAYDPRPDNGRPEPLLTLLGDRRAVVEAAHARGETILRRQAVHDMLEEHLDMGLRSRHLGPRSDNIFATLVDDPLPRGEVGQLFAVGFLPKGTLEAGLVFERNAKGKLIPVMRESQGESGSNMVGGQLIVRSAVDGDEYEVSCAWLAVVDAKAQEKIMASPRYRQRFESFAFAAIEEANLRYTELVSTLGGGRPVEDADLQSFSPLVLEEWPSAEAVAQIDQLGRMAPPPSRWERFQLARERFAARLELASERFAARLNPDDRRPRIWHESQRANERNEQWRQPSSWPSPNVVGVRSLGKTVERRREDLLTDLAERFEAAGNDPDVADRKAAKVYALATGQSPAADLEGRPEVKRVIDLLEMGVRDMIGRNLSRTNGVGAKHKKGFGQWAPTKSGAAALETAISKRVTGVDLTTEEGRDALRAELHSASDELRELAGELPFLRGVADVLTERAERTQAPALDTNGDAGRRRNRAPETHGL